MKSAALTHGSGPGSSIALSPTSIRVRDAIIEKFIDKSLDELNNFLTSALDTERDESKRIGILAARVYILRTRISKIMEFNQNSMIPSIEAVTPDELVNHPQSSDGALMDDSDLAESAEHLEEWNELMTIEAGEVNGVRIPSGVAITVGREDAARLIETGKAKFITEEGIDEKRTPENDAILDPPDMEDMDTESKTESTAQKPIRQAEETLTAEKESDPEFTVEDSGMSDTDTTTGDGETNLQGDKTAQDTPTPNDDNAKAEIEPEVTVEDPGVSDTDTTTGDGETNLQGDKTAQDTPTPNDDNAKAETEPEVTVEDSGMSDTDTTTGDGETNLQGDKTAQDTPTPNDDAETDETKTQS